ncbi:hypothetical protein ACY52_000286 [Salmonella enterica subsp. enterica serovar Gaminara]|nr:hypothetical protein [Salmonella enterica subsp. enterica serovar Gaminara]
MNRACSGPEGARPRDGLSSGAASQSPPHRYIQERARTKVRAFFALSPPVHCRMAHSSQAPYPVYISAAPPGNNTTIRLPILAKNFSEFYFAPLV